MRDLSGVQTAGEVAAFIAQVGRFSEINGVSIGADGLPLKAIWAECEVGRIQRYLPDEAEARAAYDFGVTSAALEPPFSLKVGSSVKWIKRGWEGVVRRIDIETEGQDIDGGDAETGVTALVVLRQR